MGIKLPKLEELSPDEQLEVTNLPLDCTYVVTGGPGSGKTILGLYRAKALMNDNSQCNIMFLVYNKTLYSYLESAINDLGLDSNASVSTWHSWFWNYYKSKLGSRPPQVADYEYDWNAILKNLHKFDEAYFDHLILDEAQDFPEPLLRILHRMSKNATVFADDHQQIDPSLVDYSNKSKIMEITRAFDVPDKRYHLSKNYRNTSEIYNLARLFYTGDPRDVLPKCYRSGDKPKLIRGDFDEIIDYIAIYADNNPSEDIGVLIPAFEHSGRLVKKYYEALNQKCKETNVQFYISNSKFGRGMKANCDFNSNGIKIMTFLSAKGLEFDTVFIPGIDHELFEKENHILKNQVYVSSTRARDKLIFTCEKENPRSFVYKTIIEHSNLIEF